MTTALVIILMPHPWASVAAMAGSFDDESEDEDIGSAVAIARRWSIARPTNGVGVAALRLARVGMAITSRGNRVNLDTSTS